MTKIGIVLAADRAFVRQLAVVVKTLSERLTLPGVRLYILHQSFDAETRSRIEALVQGDLGVAWRDLGDVSFDGPQLPSWLPTASLYRFTIPEIVGPDIGRAQGSMAWAITEPDTLADATRNPAVIHFNHSSLSRPWERGCTHPRALDWLAALDQTPWAGWRPAAPAPPPPRIVRAFNRVKRAGTVLLGG